MGEAFTYLGNAIEGAPTAALAAAFAWGVLSVLLSPCHLAGIPLVVGYISDRGTGRTRDAFLISLLFALGILITIAALGSLSVLSVPASEDESFGLYLLDVISLPWFTVGGGRAPGSGYGAALLMGLLFGAALGPCTFAYMAPVLGATFRLSADAPLYGASLLGAFGVGHCAVIAVAGTSAGAVGQYLAWGERSRGPALMRKTCGGLLLLGGLYLLYLAP